jgi:hypothetical protein
MTRDPENAVQAKLWVAAILIVLAFPFLFVWYHARNFVRWLIGRPTIKPRGRG